MKMPCVLSADRPRTLRVTGELDIMQAPQVIETLSQMEGSGDIHLDLSGLTFMDCSGLRVLFYAAALVHGTGSVIVDALSPPVARVLQVSGVMDTIPNLRLPRTARVGLALAGTRATASSS